MKKIVGIMVLAAASVIFVLPTDANAQRRVYRRGLTTVVTPTWSSQVGDYERRRWRNERWRDRRESRRLRRAMRNRDTYGYRNYGQYRRTQVGNRRFRLTRQYYWNDGRRYSRMVRVYY